LFRGGPILAPSGGIAGMAIPLFLRRRGFFEGRKPAILLVDPTAFKKAQTEQRGKQERLL
jgi:hypothetical protein